MVDYEKLYNDVKNALSERRFKHTEGVVKRAIEYAECYDVDIETVKYAALAHDIAKELTKEESYRILEKYNVELDNIEKENFNLIHSKVGALIAKYKYNLGDEIASSIKYHTTGKENMTILEKIIYLADATEPNRDYTLNENEKTLDELVKLIKFNIDDGLIYVLNWSLKSVLKRNLLVHLDTVKAYNYYVLKKL